MGGGGDNSGGRKIVFKDGMTDKTVITTVGVEIAIVRVGMAAVKVEK